MSAEDFADIRAWSKEQKEGRRLDKEERRKEFRRYFDELGLVNHGWRCCHNDTHYQYDLLGDVLDFWPGPGKFRWRGKTHTGRVFEFIREKENG